MERQLFGKKARSSKTRGLAGLKDALAWQCVNRSRRCQTRMPDLNFSVKLDASLVSAKTKKGRKVDGELQKSDRFVTCHDKQQVIVAVNSPLKEIEGIKKSIMPINWWTVFSGLDMISEIDDSSSNGEFGVISDSAQMKASCYYATNTVPEVEIPSTSLHQCRRIQSSLRPGASQRSP